MLISPRTVSGLKHVWFAGPDYDNVDSYADEHIVLGINTVEANKSKFSKQDVIQIEAAWERRFPCVYKYNYSMMM